MAQQQRLNIALCAGEPAGIGADIILQFAAQAYLAANPQDLNRKQDRFITLADPELMLQRAKALNLNISLRHYDPNDNLPNQANELIIYPIDGCHLAHASRLHPSNANYVLNILDTAIDGCLRGEFAAMVTAPVQKSVINEAGLAFTGHTEYLAEKTARNKVVMMLAHETLRVCLATTHLPLKDVPAAITADSLRQTVQIIDHDLRYFYGIKQPRILACGLNPHAGENGHLGREEIEVIEPCFEQLRGEGLLISGPLPADTLFTAKHLDNADVVLAMYHDQGLPVLKSQGFGQSANITLGLPIIRTSVDHGTAIDLVGSGKADIGSLITACQQASIMANARQLAELGTA